MEACKRVTLYSVKAFRNCPYSVKMEYKKVRRWTSRRGEGGGNIPVRNFVEYPLVEISRNGLRLDFSIVRAGIVVYCHVFYLGS